MAPARPPDRRPDGSVQCERRARSCAIGITSAAGDIVRAAIGARSRATESGVELPDMGGGAGHTMRHAKRARRAAMEARVHADGAIQAIIG
jgi:pyruvate/2-oxoglutarate dehydrogenase complex dihydrolipoamide acyltransferase (E2) component